MVLDVRELLHKAAYHPIEIDRLLDPANPSFITFDPVLGYELKDYGFKDGMEKSHTIGTYEKHGGHRKLINYADQPCRINTYGNSFTQCAQVSDGETWQEILAAHLRLCPPAGAQQRRSQGPDPGLLHQNPGEELPTTSRQGEGQVPRIPADHSQEIPGKRMGKEQGDQARRWSRGDPSGFWDDRGEVPAPSKSEYQPWVTAPY